MTASLRLLGERFGRLTVIEYVGLVQEATRRRRYWLCRCDCGREVQMRQDHLTGGNTQSCGCRLQEYRHGLTRTPEYSTWKSMLKRCENPRSRQYADYGGRGIKVCERWHSFTNFFADMGGRPTRSHSIERLNNNQGYEPGNCRWATAKEQANNRRPRRWWKAPPPVVAP